MALLQTFDSFFDLPGELREQILGHLLIRPDGIICGPFPEAGPRSFDGPLNDESDDCYERQGQEGSPGWPLNYFLVSQAFNREATAVYFRENTFYLWASGRKRGRTSLTWDSPALQDFGRDAPSGRTRNLPALHPAACEVLLKRPEWARSRRRIRSIVLYLGRLRGGLDQNVFQPLSDMVLAGGLKSLEARLYDRGPNTRPESFLGSTPMQWLYRLLSDPDLNVARLRALLDMNQHPEFWCPFHKGGESACGNNSSPGPQLDATNSKRNGRFGQVDGKWGVWVDLDIEALIEKHGAMEEQFRIFKVGD